MNTDTQTSAIIEEVECPLCQAKDFAVLTPPAYPKDLNEENLLRVYSSSSDHLLMDQMVQCHGCSLVYLNPRVRTDIIMKAYSSAVDPRFIKQNDLRIRTFKREMGKIIAQNGLKPSKEKKVLDIGCAGGAFPKAASDLGYSAIGVEPSSWMCEYGKMAYGLDLRVGTLADHHFPDAHFDIVTLWDVIEHLTEPAKVLKEVRRILKDDGLLIVNFPDYDTLARKLLGKKWPFFLSVHLFYFTPKTISRLLGQCGFKSKNVRAFWQTLELAYVFERATPYFKPLRLLAKLIRLVGAGSVPLTYNLGQSMAIATKV